MAFTAYTRPNHYIENQTLQAARISSELEEAQLRHAYSCASRWLNGALELYEAQVQHQLDADEIVYLLFIWCKHDGIKADYHEAIVQIVGEIYFRRRGAVLE